MKLVSLNGKHVAPRSGARQSACVAVRDDSLHPAHRRALAWALTLCMALMLLPMFPLVARAADESEIWGSTLPDISLWTGDGNTVTIDDDVAGTLVVPADVIVTISGSATGLTNGITLEIGSGAKVIFEADIDGDIDDVELIKITGEGEFEIAGGSIENTGSGGIALLIDSSAGIEIITVSGNAEIRAQGGTGIYCNDSLLINGFGTLVIDADMDGLSTDDNVTISGGTIEITANIGSGILANSDFTITGGKVTIITDITGGYGIQTGGSVFINSGTVDISSGSDAINALENVTISGGWGHHFESSNDGRGIAAGNNVAITGGSGTVISSIPADEAVLAYGELTHKNVTIEGSHNGSAGPFISVYVFFNGGAASGGAKTFADEDDNPFEYIQFRSAGGGGWSSPIVIYHYVVFRSNGGSAVPEQRVQDNSRARKPADPTREGYTFDGWFVDSGLTSLYDFNTPVTKSITLYAGWTEIEVEAEEPPPPQLTDEHIMYIDGYPDGTVHPDDYITRAEAAAVFFRLIVADDKESPVTSSFSDVRGSNWYYQNVAYLQKYNILKGYLDGTFKPDAPITRAEFAAIASRFDKLELNVPNIFDDVPADHWAIGYINSAYAKGWVNGISDSRFRPDENITRAQVVSVVNRMLDRSVELENIPDDARQFSDVDDSHWAYCDIVEASNWHDYVRNEDGHEIWVSK